MRIHHLNCGSFCPRALPLFPLPSQLVCHVFLIETNDGLVLVDTGLGRADMARKDTFPGIFRWLSGPTFTPVETAWQQVQDLGYSVDDVRHLIVTHLDLDHAGGMADFPKAKVHLLRSERDTALAPRRLIDRLRYHQVHWAHGPDWATYEPAGDDWFGLECVRQLEGLPDGFHLVPLPGHSAGHTGVAIDLGTHWLLHAGDAYYRHEQVYGEGGWSGLQLLETITQTSERVRRDNLQRLRTVVRDHGDRVQAVSAHDWSEWDRCRKG